MKKKQIKQKKQSVQNPKAEHLIRKNRRIDRRAFMEKLIYGSVGLVGLGGLGYWGAAAFVRTVNESDLSRIGQGRPAIVQIHDPQCTLCLTLQKQTRSALAAYDQDSFEFLVANINSRSGRELATRHGVPHVTLLLFDGSGKMMRVVRGPTSEQNVKNSISAFLSGQ